MTATLSIQATNWSALEDIHDVRKISDEDTECLREVREVLKKYQAIDRFGVTLLHKHFELSENEVLFETTDAVQRTQTVRPLSSEANEDRDTLTITALRFTGEDSAAIPYTYCRGGGKC